MKLKRRLFLKNAGLFSGSLLGLPLQFKFPEEAKSSVQIGKPEDIKGIFIVAPSVVKVGESFDVSLKMLIDEFHVPLNAFTKHYPTVSSSTSFSLRFSSKRPGFHYQSDVPLDWNGTLKITSDPTYSGPSDFSFKDCPGPYPHDNRPIGKVGPIKFTRAGTHFITFKDLTSGVEQISNPIYATDDEKYQNLYWGDIHGHTILTDGVRSPEEYYYFGRDEAFLDICALSDHPEFYLTDYMWDYFTAVTNGFNNPGRFVTLQAFEWTNYDTGHRCLYFPADKIPCIRSTDSKYSTLESMYKFVRENRGLAIVHHPATKQFPCDWSMNIDDEVERLLEVYSCWGTSERPVGPDNIRAIKGGEHKGSFLVDALRKGLKYGIIASTDAHYGRPGHQFERRDDGKKIYQSGLMGVWADKLDRESVFEAIWNRRVYGTTGTRTFLRFSINDMPMGSIMKPMGSIHFKVHAIAEVLISKVEIVKDGEDYKILEPNENEVNWDFSEPTPASGSYYVRVTRADEELAWSSPIWVES